MATPVSGKVNKTKCATPLIGSALLDVLTAGMYTDPLMIIREYIQNSADSIDLVKKRGLLEAGGGRITIDIAGSTRTIKIQDNGTGIPRNQLERHLVSIGSSVKHPSQNRGFRGIGRLGGVAYCQSLRFETRTSHNSSVHLVEWDCAKIEKLSNEFGSKPKRLAREIQRVVSIGTRRPQDDDPDRFFRVVLSNVRRFHADDLMNVRKLRAYISQAAPVPYDTSKFSFGHTLQEKFKSIPGVHTYEIVVNGVRVYRPYADSIEVSPNRQDQILDIRHVDFQSEEGGILAAGWYAHSSHVGALPSAQTMRGIRLRVRNMEVGDERCLEEIYSESRFAMWHIGEIHIVDPRMRPNARRDGFEASPSYERFLQQVALLGRHLSRLCRNSSADRSAKRRMDITLCQLEKIVATKVIVSDSHRSGLVDAARALVQAIEKIKEGGGIDPSLKRRFDCALRAMTKLRKGRDGLSSLVDGRILKAKTGKALLQEICTRIIQAYEVNGGPQELLERVISPYLKRSKSKSRRRT